MPLKKELKLFTYKLRKFHGLNLGLNTMFFKLCKEQELGILLVFNFSLQYPLESQVKVMRIKEMITK